MIRGGCYICTGVASAGGPAIRAPPCYICGLAQNPCTRRLHLQFKQNTRAPRRYICGLGHNSVHHDVTFAGCHREFASREAGPVHPQSQPPMKRYFKAPGWGRQRKAVLTMGKNMGTERWRGAGQGASDKWRDETSENEVWSESS